MTATDEKTQNRLNKQFFRSLLEESISELFAVIIGKGFEIVLNGKRIEAVALTLLVSKKKGGIRPYVFKGIVKDVKVEVVVGFHRDPSKVGEADEDEKTAGVMRAGWSVICNDRLVLYGNKDVETGWGTRGIPYFHPQYNSIAGVVTMQSDNPGELPLNTTKHGIDVSFGVYLKVLDYMSEGVKRFIAFTNRWKGRVAETAPEFVGTIEVAASEVSGAIPEEDFIAINKSRLAEKSANAKEYMPDLPVPPRENSARRICFSRPTEQVRAVANALFADEEAKPGDVGAECFDRFFATIRPRGRR
ncbi:MAG: hypothetical protein U0744_21145 [Gemmataceae bacterium]